MVTGPYPISCHEVYYEREPFYAEYYNYPSVNQINPYYFNDYNTFQTSAIDMNTINKAIKYGKYVMDFYNKYGKSGSKKTPNSGRSKLGQGGFPFGSFPFNAGFNPFTGFPGNFNGFPFNMMDMNQQNGFNGFNGFPFNNGYNYNQIPFNNMQNQQSQQNQEFGQFPFWYW